MKLPKPVEQPKERMTETEVRETFEGWQRRILPPSLRKLYQPQPPEARDKIIRAQFSWLCMVA